MSYDILITIIICALFVLILTKQIINDFKNAQNNKNNSNNVKNSFSKMLVARAIYGCLITIIIGCISYIYLRLSGKLENVFPYILSYYGLTDDSPVFLK